MTKLRLQSRSNHRLYQTKFRRRLLYALLAASSFFALGLRANAAEDLNSEAHILGLGESLRIETARASKVHISDGGIVRARGIGLNIILTGRRTGRTTLRFIGTSQGDRTVFVTERKTAEAARQFQNYLSTRRGLKFAPSALPQLVVIGELLRVEDWKNLVTIANSFKVPWRLEARTFPSLRRELRVQIDGELKKLAWPGDFLRIDDSGIKLTTGTEGPKHSAAQLLAVTTMGITLDSSSTLNELEPMVRTQIVLAEIRRTKSQKLGILWPREIGIGAASSVVSIESLTGKIQALEDTGDARILAMPNLLCRSGGEAKFFAGGEIPIKISNIRTSHVEWKKYGIILNVQPRADRLGRLKFQLSTEISSIDHANKVDDLPGILTNRIETQFNLKGTQTVVLSGLIKKDEAKKITGLGLLNSIPILGTLFQSQDFQQNLTELLVFVTPEVFFPNSYSEQEDDE